MAQAINADEKKSPATRVMREAIELAIEERSPYPEKAAFIDAVHAFLGSVARVPHEILNVFTDRDAVIVEFDVHYTRHDGKLVTLPCCNVFRLRDGLIAEYRSYIDATPVYAKD